MGNRSEGMVGGVWEVVQLKATGLQIEFQKKLLVLEFSATKLRFKVMNCVLIRLSEGVCFSIIGFCSFGVIVV